MTRAGKAGEFSPWERMFVCQVPTSPHPLVPDMTENSLLSFLAMAFMADLQGAIFLNFFMNLKLSPTSFNWQTNILSQSENSAAMGALVIL